MLTVIAFIVALGLLVAIHEYGHYRMAIACGVRVLRFSVGFGRTLVRWTPKGSSTEFVIAAFPLGGYVKMLDEREAPVAPQDRHLAFNTQPLRSRAAIVAAGPAANLLLAVFLYSVVNWIGVEQPKAILASPVSGSVAERAGLVGGELVKAAGFDGAQPDVIESFEDLRWLLTRGALEGRDVKLTVSAPMREGDLVRRLGSVAVVDGQQLRDLIRASISGGEPVVKLWVIERGGQSLELSVRPELKTEGNVQIGRIGAYVGAPPEFMTVRYGVITGLWNGVVRTGEVSLLTLRMMGKMVIGEASLKNLSGPLTIAEYAGKSANLGMTQYLVFLALISVSLGVLNLLPLPVLDGGHLMYYLWEGLTGNTVSEAWMERLQRGGVAVLLLMMSIAFFNDINRLLG